MERNEIIDILNGMCERCLMKGFIQTIEEAKTLYEVFDRFRNNNYVNDEVYSSDILYFYNLATKLHDGGHTLLEESYSIYNAILAADRIDFVEIDEPVIVEEVVSVKPIKQKNSKKKKEVDGVIDISDISF